MVNIVKKMYKKDGHEMYRSEEIAKANLCIELLHTTDNSLTTTGECTVGTVMHLFVV